MNSPSDARPAATVLVVEDEALLRNSVALILADAGYRVLAAASAEEALALLEADHADLVLSDIGMPGMDGLALCRRLRSDTRWSRLPFVILTVNDRRIDMREAMQCGADDYLTKPFEVDELLAAVGSVLEHALQKHRAAGTAVSEMREAVVRSVGHEFRTPLTLVLCYADLLRETLESGNDAAASRLLDSLRSGALQLNSLVDDFLMLTFLRSRQGMGPVTPAADRRVVADTAVARAVASSEHAAAERDVTLRMRLDAAGALVAIDGPGLAQVVSRLVDNAIKFARPEGSQVVLTSSIEAGLWRLDVADDGIGIRAEALPGLFEPFTQVDRARWERGGAGLGLPIVDAMVRLYGGHLSVESEPGRGSTFTVRLPLAGQEGRSESDG